MVKLNSANYALAKTKNKLPFSARKAIYNSLVQSYLTWGSAVIGATNLKNVSKLEAVQNKIVRNLCNQKYNSHTQPTYFQNNILKFSDLIEYNNCLIGYKFRKDLLPLSFYRLFKYAIECDDRTNRNNLLNFHIPNNINSKVKFPLIEIIKSWNRLQYEDKSITTINLFKKNLKMILLQKYSGFVCSKPNCYSCMG